MLGKELSWSGSRADSFFCKLCICHLVSELFCWFKVICLQKYLKQVFDICMQTIDTRIKLAYALARQWFGVYITAETPNDGKLATEAY